MRAGQVFAQSRAYVKRISTHLAKTAMRNRSHITKILLALVFAVCVFFPLFRMFFYIDINTIKQVFLADNFGTVVLNSLMSTTLSTLIAVSLAFALAVSISRVNIRGKALFTTICILPMLIPSISHGTGLVLLFGNNGIINRLLGLNGTIYGLLGVVFGSVLYAFPVAFLMFVDILKYENNSPYEAATVLGISRPRQYLRITFPYLKKPLISVVFATFSLIIIDYGVPLTVGGKFSTLSVVMYKDVIGQLNYAKGSVYGTLLLIPAFFAFVIDLFAKEKASSSYTDIAVKPQDTKLSKIIAYTICTVVSLAVLLPILAFVLIACVKQYPYDMSFSLYHIINAFHMHADLYLMHSVIIALFVASFGTILAFITAYITARMPSVSSSLLHLSLITTAAIPGIVLGLSYVLAFRASFLYGTLAILVLVNCVHFIASPYLMIYNSMSKLNENLEDVGHVLGVSRLRIIKDVFLPTCAGTMAEMFAYFFVNCMMTISAVSFLATAMNRPLSLVINQFEAQSQLGGAAAISLMILAVNMFVKAIAYLFKKRKRIVAR